MLDDIEIVDSFNCTLIGKVKKLKYDVGIY